MHDLMLAKQISDMVAHLAKEHQLKAVKRVSIEIGDVKNIHKHDCAYHSHGEEIEISNLKFHLNNFFPDTEFSIMKKDMDGWGLREIEGE